MFKRLESLIKDVNINIILLIVLILILFSVLVYFRRGVDGFQTYTSEPVYPTQDELTNYRNFITLLISNKLPSWLTSTQMEEIRTFTIKFFLYFLISNGQFLYDVPYTQMYTSLKAAGNTDSQILDNLLAKFNNDIKPALTQYGSSKGSFYYHIAAALPGTYTNTSWVTPDITKKAQVSLRRFGNYMTSMMSPFNNPGGGGGGAPNMSTGSNVISEFNAEYTRSIAAGDNDIQLFNNLNNKLNNSINTSLASFKNKSPSLAPEILVPVGVKVFCKLSDLAPYVPPVNLMYLTMAPLNTKLLILDAVTSEVLWDPINYYIENGIVQPFPTSTVSKSYVIYTDAIRTIPNLTVDMLPLQMQQDRDSVDKIIFNSLDTFVNLYKISVLDKIIPQASMYVQELNSDNALMFKMVLNIVRFETIIYEKYSTMIEHFRI